MSKTFSVKLDEHKRDFVNQTINNFQEDNGIDTKSEAFYLLVKQFASKDQDEPVKAGNVFYGAIQTTIKDIDCPYLDYSENDDQFLCLEHFAKNKRPRIITSDNRKALTYCMACKNKKIENETIRVNRILEKQNIKRLRDFLTRFQQITGKGFEVETVLCLAEVFSENSFTLSRDGITLYCPIDKDTVNIEFHCKQKVNPDTKETPCEFLSTLKHIARFNEQFFKDQDITVPQLEERKTIDSMKEDQEQ